MMRFTLKALLQICLGAPYLFAAEENLPPNVSLLWPPRADTYSAGTFLKLKAEAFDPDGSIKEVRFYADDRLIGRVAAPPYNLVWEVALNRPDYSTWSMTAVAEDDKGATVSSVPTSLYVVTGAPTSPEVAMLTPKDGEIFPYGEEFTFSAELMASQGESGGIEFLIGTNSVGTFGEIGYLTATTPPVSVPVSNLPVGKYGFTVRYHGGNEYLCRCKLITNVVEVVRLGIRNASISPFGTVGFEVVTSFPGSETIIESSTNFVDWTPVSTNTPTSSYFDFLNGIPRTDAQWYRVVVPTGR